MPKPIKFAITHAPTDDGPQLFAYGVDENGTGDEPVFAEQDRLYDYSGDNFRALVAQANLVPELVEMLRDVLPVIREPYELDFMARCWLAEQCIALLSRIEGGAA